MRRPGEAGRLRAAPLRKRNLGGRRWRVPVAGDAWARAGVAGRRRFTKARAWFKCFVSGFGAYVYYYEKELTSSAWGHDNQLGADQPPLREVAKERCRGSNATWTIGALPANYNVRFLHPPTDGDLVLKRGSANVSDSLYGALDGPAVVLHSHFYLHWMRPITRGLVAQTRQAWRRLNQNSRLRIFANGASKS